jgi:hypothetical protein
VAVAQGPEVDSVAAWPIVPVAVSSVLAIQEADFSDPEAMVPALD